MGLILFSLAISIDRCLHPVGRFDRTLRNSTSKQKDFKTKGQPVLPY